MLAGIYSRSLERWRAFAKGNLRRKLVEASPDALEVLVVLLFALVFCRPLLDFDKNLIPIGREMPSAMQVHHIWENLKECGMCAFWYGNVEGGFPAFIDPQSSVLHPFVFIGTLLHGVVNGTKFALAASFVLAGFGHLWLGRLMGVRRSVRIWGACLAVTAGQLAPRMELGGFSLVLSIATVSLIIPALISVAFRGDQRSVVLLSIVTALMVVSGNGYAQIGLMFCVLTAVFLVPLRREEISKLAQSALLAFTLMLLLASPFLLPFIHFYPEFIKDVDPTFTDTQPLSYVPLNLVIRDISFYQTDILEKPPHIAHFAFYLGWIPVLLAVWGLIKTRSESERRAARFLAAFAFVALWIASGVPFKWIISTVKVEALVNFLGGFRYLSFVTGIAIPALIGLAVLGLDQLLDHWQKRVFLLFDGGEQDSPGLKFHLGWVIFIPALLSIVSAWNFNRQWVKTRPIDEYIHPILQAMETPGLQWVNVPFGEHDFVEPAIALNYKLAIDFYRTWHWRDHPRPEPVYEANRGEPPEGMDTAQRFDEIFVHETIEPREYAQIKHEDGTTTACQASGLGGHIEVECPQSEPGILVVQENDWSGWRARLNGSRVDLAGERWITIEVPAGETHVSLRYQPWDIWVSIALFAIGTIVCVLLWVKSNSAGGLEPQRNEA